MNRYSKYSEKAALNNRVFNVKVLIIGTFNQKKALEGAFSVIVKLQTSQSSFPALVNREQGGAVLRNFLS